MQKKVAFQLGVIVASAVALIVLSVPLIKKRGKDGESHLQPQAVSENPPPKAPMKHSALGLTIKVRQIKDDKFSERLGRVVEVLPIDRDPFSFASIGPKSSREGLELMGILWEGEKPTAIINQAFFKAGDSTDQFNVVTILKDHVVLKDGNGEFELRLKQ